MDVRIHPSWQLPLKPAFESPKFEQLVHFVQSEYRLHRCYPPGGQIFNAFAACPYDRVRVVLLGQDPYHGPGQAHGLSFSVPNGIPHPPSLVNIFKELQTDLNVDYPATGDLTPWANQGVLLINATLTVRAAQAASHQKQGWEEFTDRVLQTLSQQKEGLVFLLWGGFAQKKKRLLDDSKHLILSCGHPSPLSANRGYWFGNKHFSKTNSYLEQQGQPPIQWAL